MNQQSKPVLFLTLEQKGNIKVPWLLFSLQEVLERLQIEVSLPKHIKRNEMSVMVDAWPHVYIDFGCGSQICTFFWMYELNVEDFK